jgi:hypothetical protein
LKERIERTERYKASREKKKKASKKTEASKEKYVSDDDEDNSKKVAPGEDYQVNQAINYLKNIGLIKNLKF